MPYQDRLLLHLKDYKLNVLGIQQPGVFKYRGRDVLRDHILPIAQADMNLLPHTRGLAPAYFAGNPQILRHKYFHHLNSSQAFAFNLFLPYFTGTSADSTSLLHALGQNAQLTSWQLEAVPHPGEGTNLDALWVTDDGTTTICEVKLSEAEFGKAKDDPRHRAKLAAIYQPVLKGRVHSSLLTIPAFLEAYQILRNVWHLAKLKNGRLVFLLPRANVKPWDAVTRVVAQVDPVLRSRIAVVAIEDTLRALAASTHGPTQVSGLGKDLFEKYVV